MAEADGRENSLESLENEQSRGAMVLGMSNSGAIDREVRREEILHETTGSPLADDIAKDEVVSLVLRPRSRRG